MTTDGTLQDGYKTCLPFDAHLP